MINPYAIIAALIAAIAMTLGGYWYGHHVESLVFDAYKAEQAAQAARQVQENHDAVETLATRQRADMAATAADYKERIDALTKARDAAVADRNRDAERLQQYVTRASRPAVAMPESGTGAGEHHAAGDPSFSVGFSDLAQWIGAELFEADANAVALTEAQRIIVRDRQICNGAVPGMTQRP